MLRSRYTILVGMTEDECQFPREAELVPEWTGLPEGEVGSALSVQQTEYYAI